MTNNKKEYSLHTQKNLVTGQRLHLVPIKRMVISVNKLILKPESYSVKQLKGMKC